MASRLITMYWDVTNNIYRDSSGNPLGKKNWAYVFYKETVIINLHLVTDSSLTIYNRLVATDTFTASVDANYDQSSSSPVMAKAINAQINAAGDWAESSSGQADETQGEISIELDCDDAGYITVLGTLSEQTGCHLELIQYSNASARPVVGVFRIPIRCLNLQDTGGPA